MVTFTADKCREWDSCGCKIKKPHNQHYVAKSLKYLHKLYHKNAKRSMFQRLIDEFIKFAHSK